VTDETKATSAAEEQVPDMAPWAQQVGRFVIAFGEIEYSVCQTLVHVPEVNQFPTMKHREFKVRANAAIEHTNARVQDDVPRRALVRGLNEAIKLAESRNLIAHNPVRFAMYTDPDEQRIAFRMEIASLRDEAKLVTLPQMQALAEKAESVAAELDDALRQVFGVIYSLTPADWSEVVS
jgi:hypothetical protein